MESTGINPLFSTFILSTSVDFNFLKIIDRYMVIGGMQDYNYLTHGTMEVTLEVGCCKYPPSGQIERHWNENKQVGTFLHFLILMN